MIFVASVEYVGGYSLRITFNTRESGIVDLTDVIHKYAIASPLRDMAQFMAFELDDWPTVAWPSCGFDVSPEFLYERAMGHAPTYMQAAQFQFLACIEE